jgi:hypothetical protein
LNKRTLLYAESIHFPHSFNAVYSYYIFFFIHPTPIWVHADMWVVCIAFYGNNYLPDCRGYGKAINVFLIHSFHFNLVTLCDSIWLFTHKSCVIILSCDHKPCAIIRFVWNHKKFVCKCSLLINSPKLHVNLFGFSNFWYFSKQYLNMTFISLKIHVKLEQYCLPGFKLL